MQGIENIPNEFIGERKCEMVIQLDISVITLLEFHFPYESFSTIKEIITGGRST
jgi:hypothetical protein